MTNVQSLKWRGYDLQSIIDQRYADKLPCKADSNRHTESLKLATDLMLMLDGDKATVQRIVEAQPWVQEIIEERNEDVEQTVESAAGCIKEKEKKYAESLPSKAMLEAVIEVARTQRHSLAAHEGVDEEETVLGERAAILAEEHHRLRLVRLLLEYAAEHQAAQQDAQPAGQPR